MQLGVEVGQCRGGASCVALKHLYKFNTTWLEYSACI